MLLAGESVEESGEILRTQLAQQTQAGQQVFQDTYEGKSTKPNSVVAQFGTNPKWIEKAGWCAHLGTYVNNYEKVYSTPATMMSFSKAADDCPQRLLTNWVCSITR